MITQNMLPLFQLQWHILLQTHIVQANIRVPACDARFDHVVIPGKRKKSQDEYDICILLVRWEHADSIDSN